MYNIYSIVEYKIKKNTLRQKKNIEEHLYALGVSKDFLNKTQNAIKYFLKDNKFSLKLKTYVHQKTILRMNAS